MDNPPAVSDAALAVANMMVENTRATLRLAARLPGMRRLAEDGAVVRARARSRLEGLIDDVLASPEVARAIDRALAGTLPDVVVRSLLEHETAQRLVASVIASPGLDHLLVQATDRALRGPELQRVIEHVASSPEVRVALTSQSTTLAQEMAEGIRTRAGALDDAAEQKVRGWLRRPHPA